MDSEQVRDVKLSEQAQTQRAAHDGPALSSITSRMPSLISWVSMINALGDPIL